MRKIIYPLILASGLASCSKDEPIIPIKKNKTGCVCNDGTRIVWNENILKQTSWLTANPCYDKGGIKEYLYE